MRVLAIIAFGLVLSQPSHCRSVPDEDSVVSDYTKQPATADGTKTAGVYSQIASNIAVRITSPIIRFFGFEKNQSQTTTKRPFHRIEIFDEPEQVTKDGLKPLSNEIPTDRDVEEISAEGNFRKADKKPEKITLFSNYLPASGKIEINDTINEVGSGDDEIFGFDDEGDDEDEEEKPREGGIIYFLEVLGSIWQLILGGILALFTSSKTS